MTHRQRIQRARAAMREVSGPTTALLELLAMVSAYERLAASATRKNRRRNQRGAKTRDGAA